jgi:gliding motility-associated-like protein
VKLDPNGNLQWQKCYGGSGEDMATSIIQTTDKGFIIGAQTASANGDVTTNHGDLDYWVVKTDDSGNIIWQKCYGGSGSDRLASLEPTQDGWFVVAGSTTSQNGDVSGIHGSSNDFWVVKFGGDPRCLPTINIKVSQDKICFGTMVTFTATVTDGGTNGVYKWKKNGVVTGPNSASFVTSESMRDGDVLVCEYSCKTVCGRDTTITSNAITMTVYNDVEPEVTITASNTEVCEGTSITFTATPSFGRMTPSYQWLVNGRSAGSNSTSFTSSAIPNEATVQCVMTVFHPACQGSTKDHSNTIPITVHKITSPDVKITASATSVCKGSPVTFTATGNGGPNATYQWMINGTSINTNTPSFTTSSLSNGDDISCMMTADPATKCLTATTATSNHITVTVQDATPPTISIQASDLDICEGSNVTFTATAVNAGTAPSYQWQLNGANTGTNAPTYSNNALKHGDQVSCTLTTVVQGCTTSYTVPSNKETISVSPLPAIRFSPSELSAMNGEQLQLTPTVSGTVASFEWTSTGTSLQNAQSLTPTTAPLTATTTFRLKVVADNGCEAMEEIVVKVFSKLYMPNSFTPNGDGKNDVFRIPFGVSLQLEEFSVFDRWGNRIFTTKDASKGWDGTFKGKHLETDTFVYLLRGKNRDGAIQLKGVVLLVR